uniref:NADH dehydrogenase subunit 6 n=1 Tax=Panagrolaimus sp. JU765 TaxID=591449 RepID=A0AC34Q3K4_9BILA
MVHRRSRRSCCPPIFTIVEVLFVNYTILALLGFIWALNSRNSVGESIPFLALFIFMTTLTCFSFSRHPLFYGLLAIIFSLYVLCIILVYLTFLICALDKICRRQANAEIAKMGYKDFTDKSWF